jgi:hypothetical protein
MVSVETLEGAWVGQAAAALCGLGRKGLRDTGGLFVLCRTTGETRPAAVRQGQVFLRGNANRGPCQKTDRLRVYTNLYIGNQSYS